MFFETRRSFRAWLKSHAKNTKAVKVGFRTRPNGHACISVAEARDEAIRLGWCEGRRTAIDTQTFAMTFGPRKPNARWSAPDVTIAETLIANDEMTPPGLAAFHARANPKTDDDAVATTLAPAMLAELKRHRAVWSLFQRMPPSHKKKWTDWVMSAKQEKTRSDRFARLLMDLSRPRA